MDRNTLAQLLPFTAFTFRGYNVTNLGRTPELLEHSAYGPLMRNALEASATIASEVLQRPIDLVARVEAREETTLDSYDEAIALIIGAEQGQLHILRELHGIDARHSSCFCGYSLGEIAALVASDCLTLHDALRVPLSLAKDCVLLAEGVTLGVLFSLGEQLPKDRIDHVVQLINREGNGVLGVSAELSPNSMLLMGQGDTIARMKKRIRQEIPQRLYLRLNEHHWPPLHTPIVWQRFISDQASSLMLTLQGGDREPNPPVISLVTGGADYTATNVQRMLRRWTDQRQDLWKAILTMLDRDIRQMVHVGPAPNIIPATFKRLTENVEAQMKASIGLRTLSQISHRPWLKNMLPRRSMLLNTMRLQHITLEDWLLENPPT